MPVLADLKPSGKFVMAELVAIGGIRPLMKTLLDHGLLHGDCLTVTGRTLAENLADVPPYPEGQTIIRPMDDPIKPEGHLVILYGSLARRARWPRSPARKDSNSPAPRACSRARETALERILDGGIVAGDVIVIRSEGPRGGPGMREMLSPTSAIMGRGLGKEVALITDGRFSGGSHGFVVGHITPEAFEGGPLAIVRDGDTITIDAQARRIDLDLPAGEIETRLARWTQPAPRYTRGVLAKYARVVQSASVGAVTD